MYDNYENLQIKLARKYLKLKIIEDNLTFRGHDEQKTHIFNLLLRTVESGESNSALIIGPRGAGKTTLIYNVLWELGKLPHFEDNSILVRLNGHLHSDDKLALKSITTQMSLDNVVDDMVFGTFSENLSFLLSCLKSGKDKSCKSVLFILEEFDLFCHSHGSQTLLYNLFDVAQSKQAPICVLGVTCRLDVVELLEKRVKSRFSHRQIFIFPNNVSCLQSDGDDDVIIENRIQLFKEILCLPMEIKEPIEKKSPVDSITDDLKKFVKLNNMSPIKKREKANKKNNFNNCDSHSDLDDPDKIIQNRFEIPYEILTKCKTDYKEFRNLDPIFVSCWNENIDNLCSEPEVRNCLQKLYDINVTEEFLKKFLIKLVCKISIEHPQIELTDIQNITQELTNSDDKVLILLSLSILEISLIIAMKHQSEIFNEQPMNFEMVLSRYTKFANSNMSSQTVPRAVILKAFEHLHSLELIAPIKGDVGMSIGYIQKEYKLYRLLVTSSQITETIKHYKSLPTELSQWAFSSLV